MKHLFISFKMVSFSAISPFKSSVRCKIVTFDDSTLNYYICIPNYRRHILLSPFSHISAHWIRFVWSIRMFADLWFIAWGRLGWHSSSHLLVSAAFFFNADLCLITILNSFFWNYKHLHRSKGYISRIASTSFKYFLTSKSLFTVYKSVDLTTQCLNSVRPSPSISF